MWTRPDRDDLRDEGVPDRSSLVSSPVGRQVGVQVGLEEEPVISWTTTTPREVERVKK